MFDKANLFDFSNDVESKYSINVNIPQYLPKNEKPSIFNIYSDDKYKSLLSEINNSNVSEEEKEFLRLAATRHIMFDYAKIADYYAHSGKEMQELMERSALVIIDFEDALANGYIELTEKIQSIAKQSKVYHDRLIKYGIEE